MGLSGVVSLQKLAKKRSNRRPNKRRRLLLLKLTNGEVLPVCPADIESVRSAPGHTIVKIKDSHSVFVKNKKKEIEEKRMLCCS